MRTVLACAFLLGISGTALAECKGQLLARPNKAGVMRQVCLDGKYSTCIKDSRAGGWTAKEAKAFCDRRKAADAIK